MKQSGVKSVLLCFHLPLFSPFLCMARCRPKVEMFAQTRPICLAVDDVFISMFAFSIHHRALGLETLHPSVCLRQTWL